MASNIYYSGCRYRPYRFFDSQARAPMVTGRELAQRQLTLNICWQSCFKFLDVPPHAPSYMCDSARLNIHASGSRIRAVSAKSIAAPLS
ncbi:putative alcohol acetyltransferase FCK4 [Fusarium oxysporum f. sp. albedinis]|nr:putative alcohol acetyltransferase FCK4 [Fusarium oxysporum f. sp. albedinis]